MFEHPQPDDEMQELPPQVRQLHRDLLEYGEAWHAPAQRLLAQMRSLESASRAPAQRGDMMRQTQTTTTIDDDVPTSPAPFHHTQRRPNIIVGGIVGLIVVALLANIIFLASKGQQTAGQQIAEGAFGQTPGLLSDISMVSTNEGWAIGYTPRTTHPQDTIMFYHYLHGTWTPVPVRIPGMRLNNINTVFHCVLAMAGPDDGWAECDNSFENHFLHYHQGQWSQLQDGPPASGQNNVITLAMQAGGNGTLWAIIDPNTSSIPQFSLDFFDGNRWSTQALPKTIQNYVITFYNGFTMVNATEGWFIVKGYVRNDHFSGTLLLHWKAGQWSVMRGAGFKPENSIGVPDVVIQPNTVQTNGANSIWGFDNTALYENVDAQWKSIPLPATSHVIDINAMQVVGPQDVWLAGMSFPGYPLVGSTSNAPSIPHALIYHYLNGQWQPVALPHIAGQQAVLTGIGFSSPTQGWAAGYLQNTQPRAYTSINPLTLSVPLLLRYQNGQWSVYHQG